MKKDALKEVGKPADEPIVIPDECGDSMWDTVLEQSAFGQAVTQAANAKMDDKEDKISKLK